MSLLGGDPGLDYDSIVHELEGRRVNLARPDKSLLLAKPTGGLTHQGGTVLEDDGPGVKRLAEWIAAGAPRLQARRLTKVDVSPARCVVEKTGAGVQLRAMAHFDDGLTEDVTGWTVFTAGDPAAVEIDSKTALATVRRRGQHVVIARFLTKVVPLQLTLPLSDTPVDLTSEPRRSFIDDEVLKSLAVLRLPVSPPADDATFLRRVRIDLTGTLPSRDEVENFLADRSADKRAKLVDRLLQSDLYVDYWTLRLATLLRVQSQVNEKAVASSYHGWVRDQVAKGTPMDQVARTLLTAVGDSHIVGPATARTSLDVDRPSWSARCFSVYARMRQQPQPPADRWTRTTITAWLRFCLVGAAALSRFCPSGGH